jgi:hypothetical protein
MATITDKEISRVIRKILWGLFYNSPAVEEATLAIVQALHDNHFIPDDQLKDE